MRKWLPVLEVGLSGLLLDSPHSGTAAYARGLTAALPAAAPDFDFRLFIHAASPPHGAIASERLSSPLGPLIRGRGAAARLDKLWWETVALPLAAMRRGEALLHSLHFSAPVVSSAPVVVTVHDLIPLALPGYYRSGWSYLYSRFMARTARRAAAIITVSEHSRQDVVRLLRVPVGRVFVTPEAPDPACSPVAHPDEAAYLRARYALPDRFILYLGGAERRKNLETLIRAWAQIATEIDREAVSLVVIARFPPPDRLYPDTQGLARSLGLAHKVRFIAAVEEADKPALYRTSLAFCFPSMYEGFGLTPLEAMACGTPVIASTATSIPEVVAGAGLLVEPDDVEAWAGAILDLVRSPAERERLRGLGLARAAQFSWDRTATQTAHVYRSVLGL